MTSILPPHHMYADSRIHFRDPFGSSDAYAEHQSESWYSPNQYTDFNRALTPPPDMSTFSRSSKPATYQQEHGHHYGDYMHSQQAYRAPVTSYVPREVTNSEFGRSGVPTQPGSRAISPVPSRQATFDHSVQPSQQRRGSEANAIAPAFQIPTSVNDSGGSLSELAAQVS